MNKCEIYKESSILLVKNNTRYFVRVIKNYYQNLLSIK